MKAVEEENAQLRAILNFPPANREPLPLGMGPTGRGGERKRKDAEEKDTRKKNTRKRGTKKKDTPLSAASMPGSPLSSRSYSEPAQLPLGGDTSSPETTQCASPSSSSGLLEGEYAMEQIQHTTPGYGRGACGLLALGIGNGPPPAMYLPSAQEIYYNPPPYPPPLFNGTGQQVVALPESLPVHTWYG